MRRLTRQKHDRPHGCCPVTWVWMRLQATVITAELRYTAMWVINIPGLFIFYHVLHGCLCNRSLPGVRSPGSRIKHLHCSDFLPHLYYSYNDIYVTAMLPINIFLFLYCAYNVNPLWSMTKSSGRTPKW